MPCNYFLINDDAVKVEDASLLAESNAAGPVICSPVKQRYPVGSERCGSCKRSNHGYDRNTQPPHSGNAN